MYGSGRSAAISGKELLEANNSQEILINPKNTIYRLKNFNLFFLDPFRNKLFLVKLIKV